MYANIFTKGYNTKTVFHFFFQEKYIFLQSIHFVFHLFRRKQRQRAQNQLSKWIGYWI